MDRVDAAHEMTTTPSDGGARHRANMSAIDGALNNVENSCFQAIIARENRWSGPLMSAGRDQLLMEFAVRGGPEIAVWRSANFRNLSGFRVCW